MWVYTWFENDDVDDLQWIQHDVYFSSVMGIVYGDVIHSTVSYFYARAVATKNPSLPVYKNKLLSNYYHFDHRVLQYSMMKISAYYRWITTGKNMTGFSGAEVERERYNQFFARMGYPLDEYDHHHRGKEYFDSMSAYHKYMLEAWKLYFKHEVDDICFGIPSIANQVLESVVYQNTDSGYAAEDEISSFLDTRYGKKFKQACDLYRREGE